MPFIMNGSWNLYFFGNVKICNVFDISDSSSHYTSWRRLNSCLQIVCLVGMVPGRRSVVTSVCWVGTVLVELGLATGEPTKTKHDSLQLPRPCIDSFHVTFYVKYNFSKALLGTFFFSIKCWASNASNEGCLLLYYYNQNNKQVYSSAFTELQATNQMG